MERLRTECRIDSLLLTRSEEGMTLFDEGGALHVPGKPAGVRTSPAQATP